MSMINFKQCKPGVNKLIHHLKKYDKYTGTTGCGSGSLDEEITVRLLTIDSLYL